MGFTQILKFIVQIVIGRNRKARDCSYFFFNTSIFGWSI